MQDKYQKTKRVDAQGRVLIPSSIRDSLNIHPDSAVKVQLEGDTIKITVAETRCCICGDSVEGKPFKTVYGHRGGSQKAICNNCLRKVKEA